MKNDTKEKPIYIKCEHDCDSKCDNEGLIWLVVIGFLVCNMVWAVFSYNAADTMSRRWEQDRPTRTCWFSKEGQMVCN